MCKKNIFGCPSLGCLTRWIRTTLPYSDPTKRLISCRLPGTAIMCSIRAAWIVPFFCHIDDDADSSLSPEATFQATDFGSTRPAWRIRKLAKPTLDMEGSGKQSPKEICTPRFTLLRFTLLLSGMPLSPSHAPQAPPEFALCAVGKTTSFSLTYFY